jgi:hypothetical protein
MKPEPQSAPLIRTFTYSAPVLSRQTFPFEHDPEERILRIRCLDGRVPVFRDRPVRQLVIEPDC